MTTDRKVYAEAKIQETFPFEIAIYDLDEFVRTYSKVEKNGFTRLTFDETEEAIIIKSGEKETIYKTSNPSVVISPQGIRVKIIEDEHNTRFILGRDRLQLLKDALSKVKLDALIIKEGKIIVSSPERNPVLVIEDPFMKYGRQDALLDNKNITKMMLLDYNVEISPQRIARFVSRDSRYKITYFFALEDNEKIASILDKSWVKNWKPSKGYTLNEDGKVEMELMLRSGPPRKPRPIPKHLRKTEKKIQKKKLRNGEEQHYDENDNLVYFKSSDGAEQWYEYDKRDNLIHYKSSSGYEKWYEYDSEDNLTRSWSNKDKSSENETN